MRSSKWLVFIRSQLAGFDRSLTLLIPTDLAIDFKVITNKTIEYVRRCDRATEYENSKPKNVAMMDTHYLPIDALQQEIPILRRELEKRIRSLVGVE
jgi:hypothetical protein